MPVEDNLPADAVRLVPDEMDLLEAMTTPDQRREHDPMSEDPDPDASAKHREAGAELAATAESARQALAQLSDDAIGLLAGLIAPTGQVNPDGVMGAHEHWEAIRGALPLDLFWAYVNATEDPEGDPRYDEELGL